MSETSDLELTSHLKKMQKKRALKENLIGYAIISPWLMGFLVLTIGPVIVSFYLSFTDYNILSSPNWVGIENYLNILTNDTRFLHSLRVTLQFVFISVPLRLGFALMLAILFKKKRKGGSIFTTIYYIPSIVGGSVAISVVWRQLFNLNGAVNGFLDMLGISPVSWLGNPRAALSILILLSIWQFGSPMIIFLAGLRQIPKALYEAASVDGATKIQQFFKITLPMLTPVIFFNLVMQLIGGFMTFNQAFLITAGGPLDGTLFYAVYLYQVAFEFLRMGYGAAMAWILLVIVGIMTLLLFLTQKYWVHYGEE